MPSSCKNMGESKTETVTPKALAHLVSYQLIQLRHGHVGKAKATLADVVENVVLEQKEAIGGGLEVGQAEDRVVRLDGHFAALEGPHELGGHCHLREVLPERRAQPCAQA